MRFFILFLAIFIASCSSDRSFTKVDDAAIEKIRRDYVNGWLANDSETVLGLFESDAIIIPSGLDPIQGIEAIENYWFPKDSSETTIHSYSIELLDLKGTDSMAYTLEKGILNFTYTNGDFTMTRESISHATTTYRKNDQGKWKITSRMWTSLNQ